MPFSNSTNRYAVQMPSGPYSWQTEYLVEELHNALDLAQRAALLVRTRVVDVQLDTILWEGGPSGAL